MFVVSSESSTVAELASTLQADISQLQAAASFACRLGWAEKLIDPASILQESLLPGSPKSMVSDEEVGTHGNMGSANLFGDGSSSQSGDALWTDNSRPAADCSRVAFVVDANITSYLMMGSVSPGLSFLIILRIHVFFAILWHIWCHVPVNREKLFELTLYRFWKILSSKQKFCWQLLLGVEFCVGV